MVTSKSPMDVLQAAFEPQATPSPQETLQKWLTLVQTAPQICSSGPKDWAQHRSCVKAQVHLRAWCECHSIWSSVHSPVASVVSSYIISIVYVYICIYIYAYCTKVDIQGIGIGEYNLQYEDIYDFGFSQPVIPLLFWLLCRDYQFKDDDNMGVKHCYPCSIKL
jgi:hypothetical protein